MLSKSVTTNKYFWNGKEVSEAEYNYILGIIRNKPNAPEGFDYSLTESLEWEMYELPLVEFVEEQATEPDYQNALAEMGVNLNE